MHPMHQFNNGVGWVKLEPALGKVYTIRLFVMIVLEKLAHHEEIKRQHIFAVVAVIEIGVAILVAAPVYNSPMQRPH